MMLKVSAFVIGLFIRASLSVSIDCKTDQCAKPAKLYEELGCKAVFGPKSCCPKRYDCPDFKKLDDNKCAYEGKEYNLGELLPRSLTNNKCIETCFCTRQGNEPAKFTCETSNCGVSSLPAPGCVNIYGDLNECCSTSIVCDDSEKESLASCYLDKEYREGEKFIPKSNPCYECLCHKDFDNATITDNPHCRKLNCEIDLRYKSFVQRGCLPVFHSDQCCPVDWECPKQSKKVIKREAEFGEDGGHSEKPDKVYVVTPSKNLEEYLDIVKLANAHEESSHETTEDTVEAIIREITLHKDLIPVPSVDPFLTPLPSPISPTEDLNINIPVLLKYDNPTTLSVNSSPESEVTTLKAESTQTESSEKYPESTEKDHESLTTEKILESSTTKKAFESLITEEAFESSTTEKSPVTTELNFSSEVTTSESKSSESDSSESSESKESKESEESTEKIKKNDEIQHKKHSNDEIHHKKHSNDEIHHKKHSKEEKSTKSYESFTENYSSESQATTNLPEELPTGSTTTAAQIPTTTITFPELHKNLEEPEDITTPFDVTSKSSSEEEVTTFSTETEKHTTEIFTTTATTEVVTKSPKTEEPLSSASPEIQRALDSLSKPTEFEKLLTTLREFLEKYDSTEKPKARELSGLDLTPEAQTTEIPRPATPADTLNSTHTADALQLEQQVEFVNYTISEKKQNKEDSSKVIDEKSQHEHEIDEEPKSIVKRSASKDEVTSRNFKQFPKEKGCSFNGNFYKLGEVIKTDNNCLKCFCEYAPIGHCVLKEKCNL